MVVQVNKFKVWACVRSMCASAPAGSQSPLCVCHHSFCFPQPCYSGQRKVISPSDTGTLRMLISQAHTGSRLSVVRNNILCCSFSFSAVCHVCLRTCVENQWRGLILCQIPASISQQLQHILDYKLWWLNLAFRAIIWNGDGLWYFHVKPCVWLLLAT